MLECLSKSRGPTKLMGMDWYNGSSANTPCLAIGYDSGELQIMKNELDDGKAYIQGCVIMLYCRTSATVCRNSSQEHYMEY